MHKLQWMLGPKPRFLSLSLSAHLNLFLACMTAGHLILPFFFYLVVQVEQEVQRVLSDPYCHGLGTFLKLGDMGSKTPTSLYE